MGVLVFDIFIMKDRSLVALAVGPTSTSLWIVECGITQRSTPPGMRRMLKAVDRNRRRHRLGVANSRIHPWLLLWLPVGAVLALLGLETAGVGILLVIPVAMVALNRSPDLFGGAAAAFGVGYLTGIVFFIVRGALLSDGTGVAAFAISQLVVGALIVAGGLAWAARPSRTD
jgi:hypothetical protein